MEPLKIGIIGCSRIAKRSVIPAIIKSEYAELEIIGSRNIEKAKEFAKELGFENLHVKKTNRFINNKNYISNTSKKDSKVQPAKGIRFQSDFDKIVEEYGSWSNYVNITDIDCKFQQQKALFVDFEARLWPCTWVGAPIYFSGKNNIQKVQLHKILDHYGWNFNSLRHFSLDSVLNHEWFKQELVGSWSRTQDDEPIGKLMSCGRTCGTTYDFSSASKGNRENTVFGGLSNPLGDLT